MKNYYDFIVLGSGIAGLNAALKLAQHGTVAILTKKTSVESNTNYAQGGIASVIASSDDFKSHIHDTLEAGAGLCHEKVVQQVVEDGPEVVSQLIHFGVQFSKNQKGEFDLGQEGGHSHRRVLHAGDFTGQVIEQALLHAIKENKNISLFEHHIAIDLVTSSHLDNKEPNRCYGVFVLNSQNQMIETFFSSSTILCTGGAGKVYLYTSNPDIATGDGLAMAWRAGAKVANLEFVQFHPTCLYHPQAKSFLLSEALRGEGGILRLRNGERFMERYHSKKELAPRDVVARAIDYEMKKWGEDFVLLDMTALSPAFLKERFPNIHQRLKEFGYDMTKEPIPVVPAAHYMCGGVMVDKRAETSIKNLFACGEVSFTGLHGANRLASNSLLEAVVYANLAAQAAISLKKEPVKNFEIKNSPTQGKNLGEAIIVKQNWDAIRQLMWNYVGIVRSDSRLQKAARRLELLQEEIKEFYTDYALTPDLLELKNIACVAQLIIRSALWRKESRGLHYNIDHPHLIEAYRRDTILEP